MMTRARPGTALFSCLQAKGALVAAASSHPAPSHPGGACPPDAEDAQEQRIDSLIASAVAQQLLLDPETDVVSFWIPIGEDRYISRVVKCQP